MLVLGNFLTHRNMFRCFRDVTKLRSSGQELQRAKYEETIRKLKSELSELNKWKNKVVKREKARVRAARRLRERRELRRQYILKEIEAGRMEKRDLYHVYSQNKLPVDTLPRMDDEDDDRDDVSFDEDNQNDQDFLNQGDLSETEAAVAGISSEDLLAINSSTLLQYPRSKKPAGVSTSLSSLATPNTTRQTALQRSALVKKAAAAASAASAASSLSLASPVGLVRGKFYPLPGTRPKQIIKYQLEAHQKVCLPEGHPQINTIVDKNRIEVVREERIDFERALQQQVQDANGFNNGTATGRRHVAILGSGGGRRTTGRGRQAKKPVVKEEFGPASMIVTTAGSDVEEEIEYAGEIQTETHHQVLDQHHHHIIKVDDAHNPDEPQYQHIIYSTDMAQYQLHPAGAGAAAVVGADAAGASDQLDFLVRTVDDMESIKYPTYYIHSASPNASSATAHQLVATSTDSGVVHVIPMQHFTTTENDQTIQIQVESPTEVIQTTAGVVATSGGSIVRSSPRKHVSFNKYSVDQGSSR